MTAKGQLQSGLALTMALVAGVSSARPDSFKAPTEIALSSTVPPPCIAVETPDVRILLPKAKIDAYAAVPRKVDWKTEAQRWALIRGDQARDIEAKISDRDSDGGCFPVALSDLDKTQTRDGEYLIWKFLEDGAAAVIATGRATAESSIIMQSMPNSEGSGTDMCFVLKGQSKPFLRLTWWII